MASSTKALRYEISVQKPQLVRPLHPHPTASSACFFLSNLDIAVAPVVLETIFVFQLKPHPVIPADGQLHGISTKILKEALRRVLVPFYPLAGRLRTSPTDGRLVIDCNGEGVSFVEADADITLSELGDFTQPGAEALGPLVHPLPDSDSRPLISLQVTRFKCGGFVLGFVLQHCAFDGAGAFEFLRAWGETARGVPLSRPPFLDRTILSSRSPLQVRYPHIEYQEVEDLSADSQDSSTDGMVISRSFCFTSESLQALRKAALQDGALSKCTAFEALSGLIWRSRSTAIWGNRPQQRVKLYLAVDARLNTKHVIPEGYIGNAMVVMAALSSAGELGENPLSYAVKQVQDAIRRLTSDYLKSQIDYIERERAGLVPLGASLGITTWSKLPFGIVDFGWGALTHVGPVSLMVPEAVVFMPYGHDGKGITVNMGLPARVVHKFEELIQPYLNPDSPVSKL